MRERWSAAKPLRHRRGFVSPRVEIDVSAGVIERSGRILIAQRGPHSHLALKWEFPGGKREPGETWEACLVRELDEELGVAAEVGSWLDGVTHAYDDRLVRLRFYRCRLTRGEPLPVRCHAVRWVNPVDLPQYAFPEADADLVAWLAARAGRRRAGARGRSLSRVEFIGESSRFPQARRSRSGTRGTVVEMPRGASLEAAAERCDARLRFGCRTGDCGSCLVQVVRGAARVSKLTAAEIAFLAAEDASGDYARSDRRARSARHRGSSTPSSLRRPSQLRLACQACAFGDVTLAPAATSANWI